MIDRRSASLSLSARHVAALQACIDDGDGQMAAEALNVTRGTYYHYLDEARCLLGGVTTWQAIAIGVAAGWLEVAEALLR